MKNRRIPVTIDGVEYESILSACKALGISYKTVQSRRYINKPESEQFSNKHLYERQNYNEPIDVNGKHYKSIYAMCKDLNLDYASTCVRLKHGMDINTVINKPYRNCATSDHITINGVEYTSIYNMAKLTEIKSPTFFYKLIRGCNSIAEKQTKIQEWFDNR